MDKDLIILDDLEKLHMKISSELYERFQAIQCFGVPEVYFTVKTHVKIDADCNIIEIQLLEDLT